MNKIISWILIVGLIGLMMLYIYGFSKAMGDWQEKKIYCFEKGYKGLEYIGEEAYCWKFNDDGIKIYKEAGK